MLSAFVRLKESIIKFLGGYTAQEYKALLSGCHARLEETNTNLDSTRQMLKETQASLKETQALLQEKNPPHRLIQMDQYYFIDLCASQIVTPCVCDTEDALLQRRIAERRVFDDILKRAKTYVYLHWAKAGYQDVLEGCLRVAKKVN